MTDKTETKQKSHLFQKGQSGNPKGRPKGSKHKLAKSFIEALQSDFTENGKEAIVAMRLEKPNEYVRVIASLVPKDMNVNVTDNAEAMTDDEIKRRIAEVAGQLAGFVSLGGDGELSEDAGDTPVH